MISWNLANISPKEVTFEEPGAEQPSCAQLETQAGELPLTFQEEGVIFQ